MLWGAVTYVFSGAATLLALGVYRALSYTEEVREEIEAVLARHVRPVHRPNYRPIEISVTGSPQDYTGSAAKGLHVGRKRNRFVVLGIVLCSRRKRAAVPLGYLPQPGYTGAEHEVVTPRIH